MKNVQYQWAEASKPQVGTGRQAQIYYPLWSSESQLTHTRLHTKEEAFSLNPHPCAAILAQVSRTSARTTAWASSQSPLFHCGSSPPTLHMSKRVFYTSPQVIPSLHKPTASSQTILPTLSPLQPTKPLISSCCLPSRAFAYLYLPYRPIFPDLPEYVILPKTCFPSGPKSVTPFHCVSLSPSTRVWAPGKQGLGRQHKAYYT